MQIRGINNFNLPLLVASSSALTQSAATSRIAANLHILILSMSGKSFTFITIENREIDFFLRAINRFN